MLLFLCAPAWAGTPALIECPEDAMYWQPPDLLEPASAISDQEPGIFVFERVLTDRPIAGLRWWGLNATDGQTTCTPEQPFYEVSVYDVDEFGFLGAFLFGATLEPTITDTGVTFGSDALYLYEVTLPNSVSLSHNQGYISIWAGSNTFGCTWGWARSAQGDGTAWAFESLAGGYTAQPHDMALCVFAQPEGQCDPGFGELRVQVFGDGPFPRGDALLLLDGAITGTYDAEDGLYRFPCVSFGTHALSAELEGFTDATSFFDMEFDGQFVTVNLQVANEGDPCGNGRKGCSTTTTVFVSVLDQSDNKPINNAVVSIPLFSLSISESTAGVYVLPDLGDGTYEVFIEAPGYATRSEIIFVDDTGSYNLVTRLSAEASARPHSGDTDGNGSFSLGELLGIIQLYNVAQYHCEGEAYAVGPGSQLCGPHSSDYSGNFRISLSELLRSIQLFTYGTYEHCPDSGTDDGFCTGEEKTR